MFNVRVYGLLVKNEHVLLTDEDVKGTMVTKFPGGGLELGEGTIDCVKREFIEELNLKIQVTKHLYTTDFFVPSFFKPGDQVISIYYVVEEENETLGLQQFPPITENKQSFYWVKVEELLHEKFYFPIDKVLVGKILKQEIDILNI